MSPKQYYTFMIDPDLREALRRAAAVDPEVSEGAILRRALRAWLEATGIIKAARKRAGTRKRA